MAEHIGVMRAEDSKEETVTAQSTENAQVQNHPVASDAESAHRRYRRIWSAFASAILGKGSSVLVNLIAIPVLVRCMGSEEYGLWVTISTMVGMLIILDVGLANSLTNLISEAYAHDEKKAASHYFATAFWVMIGIVSAAGISTRLVWGWINWRSVFHIVDPRLQAPLSMAVAAAIAVFLCGLPVALGARVLAGYQEIHIVNNLNTVCSVVSLVFLLELAVHHAALPWFVVCSTGAPVLANMLAVVWILVRKPWFSLNPWLIRRNVIRRIFHTGSQFFLIQIAGLVVFNSDNLVISHYLSPAEVTPYNMIWRITSYVIILQTLANPALWPAYSEAWARGDVPWIRKTYSRVRWITVACLVAGSAVLIPFGRTIIRIWAGPAAVPSELLVCLRCLWVGVYAMSNNQSILLGAASRTRVQSAASVIAAAVNITLTIWWVQIWGTVGVLLATLVSYVLFINFVQAFVTRSILHGEGLPNDAASAQLAAEGQAG